MKSSLIVVVHNVRSAHNVGAILRTADGLGIDKVCLTGYTPYPPKTSDARLPHIAKRAGNQIAKTALGAEKSMHWDQSSEIGAVLDEYRSENYQVAALEQTSKSLPLNEFIPPEKLVLIVGNEISGIEQEIIAKVDYSLEIPMSGKKESFNVSAAAAIAMYHCQHFPK